MVLIVPGINWYSSISSSKDLLPRCPYANEARCPRYYASLSLLGTNGISTKLEASQDERLLAKWKKSEHWPRVREHAASISGPSGTSKHFSHFCPEVAFDVFGLFASELHRYADEIDSDHAHERLTREAAPANDWRWAWGHVQPCHYSECRLYSLLAATESEVAGKAESKRIVEIKPGWFGVSIDIREIVGRIWKCFRSTT